LFRVIFLYKESGAFMEESYENKLCKDFLESLVDVVSVVGDADNTGEKVINTIASVAKDSVAKELCDALAPSISGLPIISTISGVYKTTRLLYHWNLQRQTEQFLIAVREEGISEAEIAEHRLELLNNPDKMYDEIGRVLFFLEKNNDKQKSKNMAKIYLEFVNKKLGYDQLIEMYDINERLFIKDFELLKYVVLGRATKDVISYSKYQYDRLIALGLLSSYDEMRGEAMWWKPPTGNPEEYKATSLGEWFINIVS
jgi:hypothetical protein